jgi:hypothetical protein
MAYHLVLGDLICGLYDEYRDEFGDDELAALAADVTINDLFVRFDVLKDEDNWSDLDTEWD